MKQGSAERTGSALLIAAVLGLAASLGCQPSRASQRPVKPQSALESSARAPATSPPKPAPDTDRDGVADAKDACPNAPEDHVCIYYDGPPECCGALDGCPHPDPDEDGFVTELDACPQQAEYWNGFRDEDGCPDDREIEDARVTSGVFDRSSEGRAIIEQRWRKGRCGKPSKVVLEGKELIVLEKIRFAPGTARIEASSEPILEAATELINRSSDILWLEVSGHVRQGERNAVELSLQRAQAVLEALVQLGVSREKLGAAGYGAYCPRGDDPEKNEWVAFTVVVNNEGVTNNERGCSEASAHGLPPLQVGPRAAP
jgi:outer membrane protein OmpA-like peptidoglycan-associated protein